MASKHARLIGLGLTALTALPGVASAQQQQQQGERLVIAGRDGVYGEGLGRMVELYREANPDVSIELLQLPYDNLYEKLVIGMREGAGAYDVVILDDTWAPEFMAQGWLADLERLGGGLDDDFVGPTAAVSRHPYPDGTPYAVPIVGNVEMFAYRSDLFEKHGLEAPPASWSDVLNAASTIDDAEEDVSGVVFRGTKGNPIVTGFLPILWAHGGEVVDEQGRAALDSPEALTALKLFLSLKPLAPRGVETYNATEVRDALQKGRAAMSIEVWPAWVPSLDDPEVSEVVGEVEIVPAPGETEGPAPMLGAWLLAVPADAPHPELARDFIDFATSPENQKLLALEIGLPPTRESVYADPEVVEKYRWYPNQLEALRNAKARPRIAEWSQVESILGDYLQLALIGQMEPEDALSEANAAIADALKG